MASEPTDPPAPTRSIAERRRLLEIVLVAGGAIAAVELIAGAWGNSLVLLSDGGHYVTDLVAVGLAIGALTWGARPADARHSFGHQRLEVLATLANALLLWGLAVVFAIEAVERLISPVPVDGLLLVVIGGFTLAANGGLAAVLHRGAPGDLNQRAVYLHVLSDGLGSLGAIVAGGLVLAFGWGWADPVATLFVVALMVAFAIRLSSESLHVLMEGTPAGIAPGEVEQSLRALPGVEDLHDLHVWMLAPGTVSVSVHLVLPEAPRDDGLVHEAQALLQRRFHIRHSTVQVESADCPCVEPRH